MKRGERGFTMMEVLVASAIFSMVAMAVATLFAAALQISHRLNVERTNEEVALALADMAMRREVARPFSLMKIEEPGPNEWAFVGLAPNPKGIRQIGEIRYWVDSGGKLLRRERVYPKVGSDDKGRVIELASSVESLEAEDLFFDPNLGEFQTDPPLGEQSEEIVPQPDAVRITLRYRTPDKKIRTLERIVYA